MTNKTDYSSEEWNKLLTAPFCGAMLIVVSDLNVTFFTEIAAMTQAVMATVEGTKNELIKDVASDLIKKENQEKIKPELESLKSEKDPAAQKKALVDYVVETADLVSARSAEDGKAYRQWLMYLANVTAEGSKEGGFLGIGAVKVSEKEQAALDELKQALEG